MRKLIKILTLSIMLALIVLPFYGFTIKGEADFNYSLNGNIKLAITSKENENDFKAKLKTWIDGANMVSGDDDMLKLKSVTKTDSGYEISVKFRRIDKLRPQGQFELKNFADYTASGSATREYIEKLSKGNISGKMAVAYDGMLGQIDIPRTSVLKVEPHLISGEKISLEALYDGAQANKKSDIVTFKMLDIEQVEKVTVTLPGKIKYYGGSNVKIINENTIEVQPTSVRALVLKNKFVIDENGVEKIEPSVENKDIGAIVGYIVLDRGMSPLLKVLLIAGGVIVAGLIVFACVRIWYIGKKIIEKEQDGGNKSGQIL